MKEFPQSMSVHAELVDGPVTPGPCTEYKPVQLRSATQRGLRAPRTHIGNNPRAAHAFVAEVGTTV